MPLTKNDCRCLSTGWIGEAIIYVCKKPGDLGATDVRDLGCGLPGANRDSDCLRRRLNVTLQIVGRA